MITFEFKEYLVLKVHAEQLFVRFDERGWIAWLKKHFANDDGKKNGITLGAYRNGPHILGFSGGQILVWMPCARQESATGVPWPHAYYTTTIGGEHEDGSIHCPDCRIELRDSVIRESRITTNRQLALF